MNVTGIIAEYNPFHNGHLYQIKQAKQNGADYIIIVMSGNFVQRGTPAILDKWSRAEMALSSGADLVLELPTVFSTASAQYFARGGISLLDKLGVVDTLSFGCETTDSSLLKECFSLLSREPDSFKEKLQSLLKEGYSFPKARSLALSSFLGNEVSACMSEPNTILALEYCLALSERHCSIQAAPLLRKGNSYHEKELSFHTLPSATAIRMQLKESLLRDSFDDTIKQLSCFLPGDVLSLLTKNKDSLLLSQNTLSLLLKYKLLSSFDRLEQYADVTADLADKIRKNINQFQTLSQFADLLKSKDLAHTRITRALTHILLDITQDMYTLAKEKDYVPYARVLGFHKRALPLLSEIGTHSCIPLITKLADAEKRITSDYPQDASYALSMLKHDIFCAHVYESVITDLTGRPFQNEYTRQIVIRE